jgi:formate dehydrogenase
MERGLTFHSSAAEMVPACDVVTINVPLHPETENLFDAMILRRMKRGAYLVSTARSATENEHTQAIFLQMAQVWQGERAAGGRQGTRLRPRHAAVARLGAR